MAKKKIGLIGFLLLVFLVTFSVFLISEDIIKLPFSIVPSFDISSWQVSFDQSSSSLECQNLDSEFELVTENLIPNTDGGFQPSKTPIKTFCGQTGGIYDKSTNTLYTGGNYKKDVISVNGNMGNINPPALSFQPIQDIKVVGMQNFIPSWKPFGLSSPYKYWYFDYSKQTNNKGFWLAEYNITLIKDGDQVIDAVYSFTGNVNKCTAINQLGSQDASCTFGGSVQLSSDKIYFLRSCEPQIGKDCNDVIFNGVNAPSHNSQVVFTIENGNAVIGYDLIKEQQFTEKVSLSYTVPKEIIPDRLHYRKYSCPLIADQFLATETFDGGSVITKDSFRFFPNYFCSRHPVIVTDSITGSSNTCPGGGCVNKDWYEDLVAGGSVTCPVGDTCTFFYVVKNNGQLPVICEEGTYDSDTGKCVSKPGIVHICSEGQFDPTTGLCVVQPDSSIVCEKGRYDVAQAKCIWNPPVDFFCLEGTYSPTENICIVNPEQQNVCPDGFVFESDKNRCAFYPTSETICPKGVYDAGLNACVFNPDLKNVCLQGNYNPIRDACVIKPDISYLCLNGYYNEELDACIIFPIERIFCNSGFVYDQSSDKCVKKPSETIDCPDNYNFDASRNVCSFTPEIGILCPSGTNFNEAVNKCEYTPEIGILCPEGVAYDSNSDKCIIRPPEEIVCNDGALYDFNSKSCIKRPAVVTVWIKFLDWLIKLFR